MPIYPRRLTPDQRNTVAAWLRSAARQYRKSANRLHEISAPTLLIKAQDREALADLFEKLKPPIPLTRRSQRRHRAHRFRVHAAAANLNCVDVPGIRARDRRLMATSGLPKATETDRDRGPPGGF